VISVVIPNYNGAATIGACLASVFASEGVPFEAIVADDGSTDGSVSIVARYPCTLLRLAHGGAAAARNAGAATAHGGVLFFTDADCLLAPDTLKRAAARLELLGPRVVLGGTYAVEPADPGFFSRFQAVFINDAETASAAAPDYVATHALAIRAEDFRASGGLGEHLPLPILEDVEFSHRLRRSGFRLVMDPALQVRHRFGFTFARSLGNAARKARHWVHYSLANRDLLADSGTASVGLKVAGLSFLLSLITAGAALLVRRPALLGAIPLLFLASLLANRRLIRGFRAAHGSGFALAATLYYAAVYPAGVWTGTAAGLVDWLRARLAGRTSR
jgi:glycosyltransferase involved in cell wall biosynthesis